jgi:hypothetical protein
VCCKLVLVVVEKTINLKLKNCGGELPAVLVALLLNLLFQRSVYPKKKHNEREGTTNLNRPSSYLGLFKIIFLNICPYLIGVRSRPSLVPLN